MHPLFPVNDLGESLSLRAIDATIYLQLLVERIYFSVNGVPFMWDVCWDVGRWRQATVKLVEFLRSLEWRLEVRSNAVVDRFRVMDVDKRFGGVSAMGEVKAAGVIFVVRGVLAWVDQVVEFGLGIYNFLNLERE